MEQVKVTWYPVTLSPMRKRSVKSYLVWVTVLQCDKEPPIHVWAEFRPLKISCDKIFKERLTQLFILSAKLTNQVKEIYEAGTTYHF